MKHTIPSRLLSVIFACIFLINIAGCSNTNEYNELEVDLTEQQREVPIELYVSKEVEPGIYEPTVGLYSGAYMEENINLEGQFENYEEVMGQNQTFRVFEYNLNENISSMELTRCIANKKIPYIKIVLEDDYSISNLYKLIYELKLYDGMPLFIELYPLTMKNYDNEKYKEAYRRGCELIHKYTNNTVVVWSIDESRVCDLPIYYPGDKYVDWAGINIYIPKYKDGDKYSYPGLGNMDFWYKNFQSKKPMLISGLAISHFSRVDHAYTIDEAKGKLELFYKDVINDYPRLKGILYMDIDMYTINNNNNEDYRITSQNQLIEAMKELNSSINYLSELEQASPSKIYCPMKYSVRINYFGERPYISKQYVDMCFGRSNISSVSKRKDLTGEIFYDLEQLIVVTKCFYTH